MILPTVIKKDSSGERAYDLESRLLEDRIILLTGPVNEGMARLAIEELLYLNSEDSEAPIHIYIDSPGGAVLDGLGIIDTMNAISAPCYTYVTGYAASMGAAIFTSGEKGHRYLFPNSMVMIHQVSSGVEGKIHDQYVDVNFTKRLNNLLLAMIAKNCGNITEDEFEEIRDALSVMDDDEESPVLVIRKEIKKKLDAFKKKYDRDIWLFAKAAVASGAADEILKTRKVINL